MQASRWVYIRIALILLSGIVSLVIPLGTQAVPPIGWGSILAILTFSPIALIAVLAFQVANPRTAKPWPRPSWNLNPFNFREPLQFFHLAAYVCLAQATGNLVHLAVSSVPFYIEALVPLAMAGGAFLGIQIFMLLFSSSVHRGV
jgi:hypothetical protein